MKVNYIKLEEFIKENDCMCNASQAKAILEELIKFLIKDIDYTVPANKTKGKVYDERILKSLFIKDRTSSDNKFIINLLSRRLNLTNVKEMEIFEMAVNSLWYMNDNSFYPNRVPLRLMSGVQLWDIQFKLVNIVESKNKVNLILESCGESKLRVAHEIDINSIRPQNLRSILTKINNSILEQYKFIIKNILK